MTKAHPVVAAALQQALVDLTDLSLQGKQAHWNIEGPGFRSLHLHLDEIIDEVRLAADDVAERIKATLDPVDEHDHLSNDLLIGIATGLEKQAWMLRAATKDLN